ncbi:MAG: hypothetical protein DWQ44_09005 [Bacteroidetes bacterium]|nr:MAG: hypothetical protein DWQ33_02770 [Bacteroidota bacterium]REK06428.1 MAG: hypothetical protein DWQ39_02795 [Bacteroidota bacterium]REK33194.1 MAG: hypothetical protein DWQ44_09005 [Bacteroidota bacterium]REK47030.1 MAG: hypothetical protein DWQ48_13335 [Bacteroidota bacterium]
MIRQAHEHLSGIIRSMELFRTVIDKAETVFDDKGGFPAHYVGSGKYKPINLQSDAGVSYIRQNGHIEIENSGIEPRSMGETYKLVTLPLKLVFCIDKEAVEGDSAYSSGLLFATLMKKITQSGPLLRKNIGAEKTLFDVISYEDRRDVVLTEEFPGSEVKDLLARYTLASMEIKVRTDISLSCLEELCNEEQY